MLFVTGAGMKPVQAPARSLETHGSLLKWVNGTAEPGASPVASTRELESKCLKKEKCALIMKAGVLEVRPTCGDCAQDMPPARRKRPLPSLKIETMLHGEGKMPLPVCDGR